MPLTSAVDGIPEHSILAEVLALLERSVGPAAGAPLHALGGKQTLNSLRRRHSAADCMTCRAAMARAVAERSGPRAPSRERPRRHSTRRSAP